MMKDDNSGATISYFAQLRPHYRFTGVYIIYRSHYITRRAWHEQLQSCALKSVHAMYEIMQLFLLLDPCHVSSITSVQRLYFIRLDKAPASFSSDGAMLITVLLVSMVMIDVEITGS